MAESYFSIVTAFDAFGMNATTSINRTLNSKVTEFPVEDGGFGSDNVVNSGDTIRMEGIISSVASNSGDISPSSFIAEIERIRNAKELVKVNIGVDYISTRETPIFKSISDCIITSVSFTQNKQFGISAGNNTSYQVSISFKKIRIIDRPTSSIQQVSVAVKDQTSEISETPEDKTTKRVGNLGTIDQETGQFTRFDFTNN